MTLKIWGNGEEVDLRNIHDMREAKEHAEGICHLCGVDQHRHDCGCPNQENPPMGILAKYEEGFSDGRLGHEPKSNGTAYQLGWTNGNTALDKSNERHLAA